MCEDNETNDPIIVTGPVFIVQWLMTSQPMTNLAEEEGILKRPSYWILKTELLLCELANDSIVAVLN